MANLTNKKFGVVHTSPSNLITNAASLEDGKLYFAAGDASGLVKQGIYGVVGVTTDGSIDIDGSGNGKQLAMFGTGAIADGTGYGLSQANFTTDEKDKLAAFGDASTYLTTTDASTNYLKIKDASYFRTVTVGNTSIVADSSKDTLEFVAGSNVTITPDESNDKITISATDTVYTGTSPINVNGATISHANSGVTAGGYGDSSSIRTLEFGDKFKVVDVSVNEFGHVTKAASYELTLPSKPATAGTADKTTGTLTFKVNGEDASAFNGSTNTSIDISAGANISISGASDGVIKIDTSGVPTTTEMNNAINTALSSALQYKGTVNDVSVLPTTGNKVGDVYVCSTLSSGKTYYETKQNDVSVRCESGDLFIWNGTYFDIVNGENQVDNKNVTLSIGGIETIATVDGTDITVSLPSSGYYTHPVSTSGTDAVSASDGGDFVFSNADDSIQVLTGVTRDTSGHIGKVIYKDLTLPATAYSDTVYTHPASTSGTTLADSSLKSTDATQLSHEGSFTVATGVYRDASGHISKVATETFKLPEQYEHPAAGEGIVDEPTNSSTAATLLTRVKIDSSGHVTDTTAFNGTVGGTTTPVYFNAGVPTALGYTIATSVPLDAIFTDKNVQDTSGTGKSFILGHATQGSTAAATTNASVYMQSGKMYATSGSVAFNDTALVTGGAVYTAVEAATIYWETL